MSRMRITGGRVIDPAADLDAPRDVLVEDGRVRAIDGPGSFDGLDDAETVDAAGCWVTPGWIDMHVHLREPGFEYKETIATGTLAAVAGGFTAVAAMANTDPVNDSGAVTQSILETARKAGLARVHPVGAVTKNLAGESLAEMVEMRDAGIVAVSDDGHPVMNAGLMRRAMEYARGLGLAVLDHAEDRGLSCGGCMHEGAVSLRLGLPGIPSAAEDVMVARDVRLAELTGAHLHVCHLSTRRAVAVVRDARARGVSVSAEAAPHHFMLTDAAVGDYDTNAKMNPPLREAADVEAVRTGLADGTIDVVATDHAPHHADEKAAEFVDAPFGIIGLETALPLVLELWRDGVLSETALVAKLTSAPARILGIPGGSLRPGEPADVTVIDPEAAHAIDPSSFRSKSRNTPFGGRSVRGRARFTIVDGRIVHDGRTP